MALVLVSVVLLTRYAVQSMFVSYQETVLARQAQGVARVLYNLYQSSNQNWGAVAPLLLPSTRLFRSDIWVVDRTGKIVFTQPSNAPASERPPLARVSAALHGTIVVGVSTSLLGQAQLVWATAPIQSDSGQVIGAAYLVSPSERPQPLPEPRDGFSFPLIQTTTDFVSNVETRLGFTGVLVGLLAVALGVWLARSITEPIQDLRRAVGRIAAGDLTQRVAVRTSDEVGALGHDINVMAQRLEGDVTELRRQEQLRRDLVANVSHDLATPLTGIQGFTEALIDGVVASDQDRQELYESIYREVQRLRRLVGDLQDLSSLENGMGNIQPAPLRLQELVDEALRVESNEASERGIILDQNVAAELPDVWADGDRITQVLFNLLDNAMRYTPRGGKITVSARTKEGSVRVSVRDTGTGIAESELPFVFERFYRVDRSRSRETGGGGLGLAIVKAIISAHGGEIEAKSVLNQGTEMTFTLRILKTSLMDGSEPLLVADRRSGDAVAIRPRQAATGSRRGRPS
ncbi:MAG: cell wall metabolism sensor histidine kinase WalK [Chloroflexi bacterium]|nr:cell wall metabolism sensor histidine kinase WalK [Chloroflexota bacterium]